MKTISLIMLITLFLTSLIIVTLQTEINIVTIFMSITMTMWLLRIGMLNRELNQITFSFDMFIFSFCLTLNIIMLIHFT